MCVYHYWHFSCASFALAWLCKQPELPLQALKNPQELLQRPLHSKKLTDRCGIASFGVFGPSCPEDNEDAAVIVTSERYVEMLGNLCEPEFRRRGTDHSSVWFQQDWATAHTASASVSILGEIFPQRVIFCGGKFHGLRVRLISPVVFISDEDNSIVKFLSLSLDPSRN
jgi:hypothetical protein